MHKKRFLTVEDLVQDGLGSHATVWRYIKDGKLPSVKLGRTYRVPASALDALEARALSRACAAYDITRDGSVSEEA